MLWRPARGARPSSRFRGGPRRGVARLSLDRLERMHLMEATEVRDMFEGLFQPLHLLLILGIALVVFGPSRLPELGKGLGEAIRGFKGALQGAPPSLVHEPAPQAPLTRGSAFQSPLGSGPSGSPTR